MRVGTFNIRVDSRSYRNSPNAWSARKDDVVALIRKLNLDVFGLQEAPPHQLNYLRAKLPDYDFVGEYRNADRKTGEASPVCYRKSRFTVESSGTFWLSETPETPGRRGWGAACPRVCSYLVLREKKTGRRLCFTCTHTDHVSAVAREKGMALILERMKRFSAGAPVVFVGDHNCHELSKPARLAASVLKDAVHHSQTPPRGAWRTYNGWRWREKEFPATNALTYPSEVRVGRSRPATDARQKATLPYGCGGSRIDYIYVSPGIRVLDYATIDEPRKGTRFYPSDHFPVVATIQFDK
jgi:endonuclease/exonuclease/phosphatase family metal-dependent hydrolase